MASARRRGERWTALYRDADGKQKSAGTFGTEEEATARAMVAELDARPRAETEVYASTKRGKPTLAGYGPTAIAGARLEATSRYSYRLLFGRHVAPALGSTPLADLTPADIRAFARKLESFRMASKTAHLVLCTLKLIVRTAVQDGLMEKDITVGVSVKQKGSKEKVIATPEQAKSIEAAFDPHYRLMVRTMFATGARFGEIIGIKAEDVCDRPGGGKVIKIRRTIAEYGGTVSVRPYGKTAGAMRDIPVSEDLASKIAAQGEANPDGYVFRNHRGECIRLWQLARDSAGVPGLVPHGARHSVASWLANTPGMQLVLVRDMLGHSSIAQTSAYIHAMIGDGDDPRLAALERIAA